MEEICKKIVQYCKQHNMTIALMESCTGGFLTNEITNIEGASEVLKVSLVTYSNEYKIEFGVERDIINNYSVYSNETSKEMAIKVAQFAKSDIGVGITGQLGNNINKEQKVYYTIYLKNKNESINKVMQTNEIKRKDMKRKVAEIIFMDILGGLK